ncbi:MAG: hypothetical protein JRJ49_05455 [Deltaproteobacteria bacterium]|nr:hypothetical protein [Deltaproteobacteria bacterium]
MDCIRTSGVCGLAPAMVVNDKRYGGFTPDRAIEKLQEYN